MKVGGASGNARPSEHRQPKLPVHERGACPVAPCRFVARGNPNSQLPVQGNPQDKLEVSKTNGGVAV